MVTVTDLLLHLDERLSNAIHEKYKSNVAASRATHDASRDESLVGFDEGYLCGLEAAAAIFEEIQYEWNEKQSAYEKAIAYE
ncbi:MAG: hypothetical protein VW518_05855 [Burkholderiaceae bacterium]